MIFKETFYKKKIFNSLKMLFKNFLKHHFVGGATDKELQQCPDKLANLQKNFNESLTVGFNELQNKFGNTIENLENKNSFLNKQVTQQKKRNELILTECETQQTESNKEIEKLKNNLKELEKKNEVTSQFQNQQNKELEQNYYNSLQKVRGDLSTRLQRCERQNQQHEQSLEEAKTLINKLEENKVQCKLKTQQLKKLETENESLLQEQNQMVETMQRLTEQLKRMQTNENRLTNTEIENLQQRINDQQQEIESNKSRCEREIKVNKNKQQELSADVRRLLNSNKLLIERNNNLLEQSNSSVLSKLSNFMKKLDPIKSIDQIYAQT